MQHLRSEQYTHVSYDCPVHVDMHPADDLVEVTLGEHRFGEDTLRLVVDHPDTFARIEEALRDGRNRLVAHLRAKATRDPAMSQLDPR
jgi:hypothetical protein